MASGLEEHLEELEDMEGSEMGATMPVVPVQDSTPMVAYLPEMEEYTAMRVVLLDPTHFSTEEQEAHKAHIMVLEDMVEAVVVETTVAVVAVATRVEVVAPATATVAVAAAPTISEVVRQPA